MIKALTVAAALLTLSVSATVLADPAQEAAEHYQRGKDLYAEGNLAAALAEFRRAYQLAPNQIVLYNIGQLSFKQLDYPAALEAFEKYLAAAAADDPKRASVQNDIATLKSRVVRIEVQVEDGVEILVNDVPRGTTPLPAPIIASAGRLKITAIKGLRQKIQTLEAVGGDKLTVKVELPPEGTKKDDPPPPPPPPPAQEPSGPPYGAIASWSVTASLAVGAAVLGGLAITSSDDLKKQRAELGKTQSDLEGVANRGRGLAIAADVFGGLAIAMGAVSIGVTVAGSGKKTPPKAGSMRLRTGFLTVGVEGSF